MSVQRIPPAGALAEIAVDVATGTGTLIRTQRRERYAIDTKSTPTDMVRPSGSPARTRSTISATSCAVVAGTSPHPTGPGCGVSYRCRR